MKIVLAHGVLGFGAIDLLNDHVSYFKGVKNTLQSLGHDVIAPFVSPTAPVSERAGSLASAITNFAAPGAQVCILAHSMGGLDARFAISQIDGVASRVRTLVTIGTPHFGSPIADLLSIAHNVHEIFGIDPQALRELEKTTALHDLTTDAGGAFEAANPDVEGIDYLQIAGIGRRVTLPALIPFHTSIPFSGTFAVMAAKRLVNDGMVPFDSAVRHRTHWEVWDADHADEIGWDLNHPAADPSEKHLNRYVRMVSRVEQERA